MSNSAIFPNSRASNSCCSNPIGPIIELIQDLFVIKILTKFAADLSIFAHARM